MKKLAEATPEGDIRLKLGTRPRHPISIEAAECIMRDIQSAISQANINRIEYLKSRPMPKQPRFKAKLRLDLRDSYGDVYFSKGTIVKITRRTPEPGEAESVLKYPYQVGGFFVDAAAFDPYGVMI